MNLLPGEEALSDRLICAESRLEKVRQEVRAFYEPKVTDLLKLDRRDLAMALALRCPDDRLRHQLMDQIG